MKNFSIWCIVLWAVLFCIIRQGGSTSILVSTNDVKLDVNQKEVFSLWLSEPVNATTIIAFTYDNFGVIETLPDNLVINANSSSVLNYTVVGLHSGHITAVVNATGLELDTKKAFVRIAVRNIAALDIVSTVIGWMYFVAWSVSFYPQAICNWKRKSVIGLNFDFLGLNITGFLFYSFFNVGMYFSSTVQNEYHQLHPTSIIPVELNDVVFALHAVFATFIQIFQCCIYERGGQRLSKVAFGLLCVVWMTGAVFLIATASGANPSTPWLTFLYYFSYVKLGITLIKYIPQAFFNWRRKSTVGWSIGNILLDFTGGTLSILQMFIIAYNYSDWNSIFGNFTKFGLGAISILFDVLFMVQHYCLYRNSPSNKGSSASLCQTQT